MNIINLSVRSLVEFVYRSGSIDTASFRGHKRMVEGTKAHQLFQAEQGAKYQKEVHLTLEIEVMDLLFQLEGRCDGLIHGDDGVVVDEIKSISRDLEQLEEEDYPAHWAQAMVYGYMYGVKQGLEHMTIQLIYYHTHSGGRKIFQRNMTIDELERFTLRTLEQYAAFIIIKLELNKLRDSSIKALDFPFEYRQGQRDLAVSVYGTILHKKRLFARAPTGIGKTISTLFPAIKALGEGKLERIFYLTAKTITRTVAEETFALLKQKGLKMIVVTLTAKEKICFKEQVQCHKDVCEFANGYYDRINAAVMDVLKNEDFIERGRVEKYARKHCLCPFELSLDLTNYADCVICDYNYAFDPKVSLKRYGDDSKRNTVLLIDEAHNLVDRSREMFSAALSYSSFVEAQSVFGSTPSELSQLAQEVSEQLLLLTKEMEDATYFDSGKPDDLIEPVYNLFPLLEDWIMKNYQSDSYQNMLNLYFECQTFLQISQMFDEHYTTMVDSSRDKGVITLYCLDPSNVLKGLTEKYRATVFFSATLFPMSYYLHLLGGDEEDYTLALASPFVKDHLAVHIHPLSTRYRDRERTVSQIVQLIQEHLANYTGNYLIFFPSYAYMNQVYDEFIRMVQTSEINTALQYSDMTEKEQEDFLHGFREDNQRPLIGFAVLGGIFSEGVNLKGDRLKGVIVVGVGLPQICTERDRMKQYFDSKNMNGYDFAYVYPGMNKVMQAGGRLIRTETDTGRLVLVDDRYLTSKYQSLLPQEWRHYKVNR